MVCFDMIGNQLEYMDDKPHELGVIRSPLVGYLE